MRPVKRKYIETSSNQITFQKVRKLNYDEFEEIRYTTCLEDNELAEITDNLKNLNIKKNISKLYNNIDNPEKIKVEVTKKVKKINPFMPDNRFNFKKTFQQEIQFKSPQSFYQLI